MERVFSIGFVRQSDRREKTRTRRGYKTGYQIFHEFAVTQGEKSLKALKKIQSFFGIGKIYLNKRYDNHTEHLYRFVVRKREDLLSVIIPVFKENTLRTAKHYDFEKFARCLNLMKRDKHLTQNGLVQIA